MSFKARLGLDWFDLTVHVVLTGLAMVVVESFAAPGGPEDAALSATLAASILVLAWRRGKALAGQSRHTEIDDDRIAQLEDRLLDLESTQQRVLELEERIDFTERLLARERDLKLGAGRED
jgi:hypothetical protein